MDAPLLIADVPWLLYRSFFALPSSIVDGDGNQVGALLGTVNALLSLAAPEAGGIGVRAVAACMGAEEAAYRTGLYPPYHAHRDPMPDPLRRQWLLAGELLGALGWAWRESPDLEADDVMFSLARMEEERGGTGLLLTGDRDLYGAVTDAVSFVELKGGAGPVVFGPDGVMERYGVPPALVPDLIALRGDPSDGIPGAQGVGAKTAAALLSEHGSLEGVLDAAAAGSPSIRPRIAASLTGAAEQLRAFKLLATLQITPVEPVPDRATDLEAGARAAAAMGMGRLAGRLEGMARG